MQNFTSIYKLLFKRTKTSTKTIYRLIKTFFSEPTNDAACGLFVFFKGLKHIFCL